MNTKHMRRLVAGLAAASVMAAAAVVPVTAAGSRVLFVGDPAAEGVLKPITASAGNVTTFSVLMRNDGKQTLSNAVFGIGTRIAPQDAFGNAGLPLPAGWAVVSVTESTGAYACTYDGDPVAYSLATGGTVAGYAGASCDLGNLTSRGATEARTLTVRLYVGATAGTLQVSGKVAENTGGNVGSNSNTFYASAASSSFVVSGQGVIAGIFKGGKVAPASGNRGSVLTEIDLTGVGAELPVYINENSAFATCPAGVQCLPGASEARVALGGAVSPYFQWTSKFAVPADFQLKNTTTLYHYDEGASVPDVTLANTNKSSCARGAKVPCADFALETIDGQTYLVVVYRTTENGFVRTK